MSLPRTIREELLSFPTEPGLFWELGVGDSIVARVLSTDGTPMLAVVMSEDADAEELIDVLRKIAA